jgi:hypothetical protein
MDEEIWDIGRYSRDGAQLPSRRRLLRLWLTLWAAAGNNAAQESTLYRQTGMVVEPRVRAEGFAVLYLVVGVLL